MVCFVVEVPVLGEADSVDGNNAVGGGAFGI